MKFQDNDKISNEDLIVIYPRRTFKEKNFEIWQFPYIKDNIVSLDNDLVFVKFGEVDKVILLTEYGQRVDDPDYIGRIELLIHDLDQDFEFKYYIFEDLLSEKVDCFIENLKVSLTNRNTSNKTSGLPME